MFLGKIQTNGASLRTSSLAFGTRFRAFLTAILPRSEGSESYGPLTSNRRVFHGFCRITEMPAFRVNRLVRKTNDRLSRSISLFGYLVKRGKERAAEATISTANDVRHEGQ